MARWRKLGLIAGAGALPLRIAAAAPRENLHVIRLEGVADEALKRFPGDECGLAELGKIIRLMKAAGCDAAMLAGVVRRPDFASLRPDWRGAALIPTLIAAAAKGDGAILAAIVETLEGEGFLVIGADEALKDLAAPEGPLGRERPDTEDFADIGKAAALIRALGPFDVGQGAVVAGGHVLAVEAAEGTDAMLDRCAGLATQERRRGVLVKRPKPGQELRVDLPVIGAETVRRAAKARLRGVAVEARAALIIDARETAAIADALGLFVYGFTEAELRAL
ncbi:MAG: LpxI family protein [Amphiplicatus sp.]